MDENYWFLPLSGSQPQGDPGLLLNILSLNTNMLNTASNRPTLGTPSALEGTQDYLTLSHLTPRPRKVRSHGWLVTELRSDLA